MKHILLTDEINNLLACSNKFEWNFEWNKVFIKRVSDAVHFNAIELMEENIYKLKEEYYAFINRTYYDEKTLVVIFIPAINHSIITLLKIIITKTKLY